VPDHEASTVVKEIFSLAKSKVSTNEIVRRLNVSKTPSPIGYAIANGLGGNYNRGNGLWNSRTVKDILTNRTYVGDLAQGRDNCLVKNTHEPLVSREAFNTVQELFVPLTNSSNNNSNITNIPRADNVLRGKVICGSCGGKIQRRKGSGKGDWYFFTCITNNRLSAGHCSGMYIRESNIMDAIRTEIGRYIKANETISVTHEDRRVELDAKTAGLNIKHKAHMEKIRGRYEDFIRGIADADDLKQSRKVGEALESELLEVEAQVILLNEEQEKYHSFCDALQDNLRLDELIRTHLEKVTVNGDKIVEVYFR